MAKWMLEVRKGNKPGDVLDTVLVNAGVYDVDRVATQTAAKYPGATEVWGWTIRQWNLAPAKEENCYFSIALDHPTAAHTPGPWKVSIGSKGTISNPNQRRAIWIYSDFHATGQITNGPEACLAEIELCSSATNCGMPAFTHNVTPEEAEANARIMAASPDMFRVLQALLKSAEYAGHVIQAPEKSTYMDNVREARAMVDGLLGSK